MHFDVIHKPDVLDDDSPNVTPPLLARLALGAPLDPLANLPLAGISVVLRVLNAGGAVVAGATADVALWVEDGTSSRWAEVLPAVAGVGNYQTSQFALPQTGAPARMYPQITNIIGAGATHVEIYWAPIGAAA